MKKVLVSLSAIAVIGTMAAAGTFALFSDTETSAGNTFTADTLDFVLNPSAAWDFPFNNVAPGFTTGVQRLNLRLEPGSRQPNHVEARIEADSFIDGFAATGAGSISTLDEYTRQIEVSLLRYNDGPDMMADGINLRPMVDDTADGNPGFISLFDVIDHGTFDNLPPMVNLGQGGRIRIQLTLPGDLPDADDNKYQGDSLNVIFRTGAAQEAGQSVLN